MRKALQVFLRGSDGSPSITWTETFEAISAARVKHYAIAAELDAHSEVYQRLVTVSAHEAEILDWARRMLAPEALKGRAWYRAEVSVLKVDDDAATGVTTSKPVDPREAAMQAENDRLRAELTSLQAKTA